MDPLAYEPRNFRELVEADLRRAARLPVKIQNDIDWQFRIGTLHGELHLAIAMRGGPEREPMLQRIGTLMHWKQAQAFIMSVQSALPDGVYAVGLSAKERCNCFALFDAGRRRWTARNFGSVKWLPDTHLQREMAALLTVGPRAMTPQEISGLQECYRVAGQFSVVPIASRKLQGL